MNSTLRREGVRFLLAGAANTAATYALYLLLLNWLDYTLAYTIAFVAGILLAYALNTRFVFRVAPTFGRFAAFPLVYLAQYLAGALILNVAVRGFGVPQRFALLASVAVSVPLTFALSRLILRDSARRVPVRAMTDRIRFSARHAAVALALWLLMLVYLICNLGHVQLLVRVSSDAPDTAQLFYSRDGAWNEAESIMAPLRAGTNALEFALPGLVTGGAVRFDPGQRVASYRVDAMRWRVGWFEVPVLPQQLHEARGADGDVRVGGDALLLNAHDIDAQLIVPTPSAPARLRGMAPAIGIGVSVLLLTGLLRRRLPLAALAMLPVAACAIVYFAASLAVGPRLPLYDDWRYVLPGGFNLIDGGWTWLGLVGNDTYFLTNQLLDFAVLKVSAVDFGVLRAVAVALLLLQLAAQWRVLTHAVPSSRLVAAIAVGLGMWSLAGGAYWSNAAIAYQQALPTLFGTLLLLQLLDRDGNLRQRVSLPLLVSCCLASGLAYISGGVMLASLGIAFVLSCDWRHAAWPLRRVGICLVGSGLALLVLQFVLVSQAQGSLLEHNHHSSSVYPFDWRFWVFFCALFGRALGYGGFILPLDIVCTALVLLPALLLGMERLRAFNRDAPKIRSSWVLLALYAGIGSASYAAVVAFGRAGFAPPDSAVSLVTVIGKGRFHFWPIATMLPFAWLGWAVLLQRWSRHGAVAAAAVAAIMLLPKSLLLLDHVSRLREIDQQARAGARCAVEHLGDAETGKPVVCTAMTLADNDIGPTLMKLRDRHTRLYAEILREGTMDAPADDDGHHAPTP